MGINPNKQEEKAIEAIADCDIMATAVGANIIKFITPVIAKGLKRRKQKDRGGLNILLCENLMNVQSYVKELLIKALGDEEKNILDQVGLVKTSIGRMVPVLDDVKYPTDVTVEEFDILHVDKKGFVGEIPTIKNMIAYSPFLVYVERKLFMHNMGHAITAYLGALYNYMYIHEAIRDVDIKYCAYRSGIESAKAIAADGHPLDQLIDFYDRLIYRFNNQALKDTVLRVGRDLERKLAYNDRIVGAINLCKEKHIPYGFLLIGVAAAFLFNQDEDVASRKIYEEAKHNLRKTIEKYTKLHDEEDIVAIEHLYAMLSKKDLKAAIAYCEARTAKMTRNEI